MFVIQQATIKIPDEFVSLCGGGFYSCEYKRDVTERYVNKTLEILAQNWGNIQHVNQSKEDFYIWKINLAC